MKKLVRKIKQLQVILIRLHTFKNQKKDTTVNIINFTNFIFFKLLIYILVYTDYIK